MNLPPLVGADVRRLTLSKRVRRERALCLVTSAATVDWLGSWPQCASEISEVEAAHEPTLTRPSGHPSHRMGEGLGGEAPSVVGSRARSPHNVRGIPPL